MSNVEKGMIVINSERDFYKLKNNSFGYCVS